MVIPNEVDRVLANQQFAALVKPQHEKSVSINSQHVDSVFSNGKSYTNDAESSVKLEGLRDTTARLEQLLNTLQELRRSGQTISKSQYQDLMSDILADRVPEELRRNLEQIPQVAHPKNGQNSLLVQRLENLNRQHESLSLTLQELQSCS